MSAHQVPCITQLDAARIRELRRSLSDRGRGPTGLHELLAKVTQEARVVPGREIPPSVVTMNSIVSFLDVISRNVRKVTLVYPADVSIPQQRISVLSPVGRALLGRSVGQTAVMEQPDGNSRELRVLRIHYQPEAAGDFTR
jgi:regulator of nucleoside diphosphate kinase